MQLYEDLDFELNRMNLADNHNLDTSEPVRTNRENTLIIFDWDDTLFPTSALDRCGQLKIPSRVRPQLQSQLVSLAALCEKVIRYCEQFGKVIIITNSAPGWIDASCGQFMPSLLPKMKSLLTFAKPMSYQITFKLDVFKRECARWGNVISIGDGIAERTASLRLVNQPGAVRKSLKLKDLPTFAQVFDQLNLCMERFEHVLHHQGDLDLRSQFGGMVRNSVSNAAKQNLTFVHLTQFPLRGESNGSRVGSKSGVIALQNSQPLSYSSLSSSGGIGIPSPLLPDRGNSSNSGSANNNQYGSVGGGNSSSQYQSHIVGGGGQNRSQGSVGGLSAGGGFHLNSLSSGGGGDNGGNLSGLNNSNNHNHVGGGGTRGHSHLLASTDEADKYLVNRANNGGANGVNGSTSGGGNRYATNHGGTGSPLGSRSLQVAGQKVGASNMKAGRKVSGVSGGYVKAARLGGY